MTKEGIINAMIKKVGCSRVCATRCLNAILDEIKKILSKGGTVVLTGFGTFKVAKRAARTGRNPKTGATIKIPAMNVARFKAGKGLKDAVR